MFSTPYDKWIRDQEYVIQMRYANAHAYANQVFNSSASLREAEARMPPIRYKQPLYKRERTMTDILGGLTNKNMEGGLDYRYGEDNKVVSYSPAPFERTFGYGRSKPPVDSDSDESESDEETENRIIGGASTALPQKYMKSVGNSTIGPWIGTGMESSPTPSVIVSGSGAKKTSPWIAHVKKWAADHKMSYRDALRDADMKKAYHSRKTGGFIPLLPLAASLIAPSAVKLVSSGVKSLWNKIRGRGKSGGKKGAGVLGGPENDVVNGAKLMRNESDFGFVSDEEELEEDVKGKIKERGYGHPMADFRKKMKAAPKKAVAAPAPVASGSGKRRSKKTGASLFSVQGVTPLNVKDAPPPPENVVANAGEVAAPLPNEVQAAAIGKGGKKPRKPRAKKVCMPVPEMVKEHEQLVKVLEDKSGSHQAVMKKEAKKQKAELKKLKKMGGKKPRAPSAWIKHVQAYAKQHGCSYKEAMSKAKASYKA